MTRLDHLQTSPSPSNDRNLVRRTLSIMEQITVVGWRIALQIDGPPPGLATLRGVFGAALHDVSMEAYSVVFAPPGDTGTPLYLLRWAPTDPGWEVSIDIHLFGAAIDYREEIRYAWLLAAERGVGRQRLPIRIRRSTWLDAVRRPVAIDRRPGPFRLSDAAWPLAGDPAATPCRVLFPTPLRVLRAGRLMVQPTLSDLVVAACRRVGVLGNPALAAAVGLLQRDLLETIAHRRACAWQGSRASAARYSGSQKRRIEMRGVQGRLDLPAGPGPAWPLLAGAQWTHLGKGTVLGLGRLDITPRFEETPR